MTEPEDPPRLCDSPADAASGLRAALRGARADVGSSAEVARLAERLGPLLAPPVAPVPPPAFGVVAKLGLTALALGLAGGGAWLGLRPQASPVASAPPPVAAPSTATHLAPDPSQALGPAPAPAPDVGRVEPAPAHSLAPAPKAGLVAPLSEAELLEQARSALKSEPAQALLRANEHRKRFPRGALVQEREVIAIKALRQLGRSAEAERRAAAFEQAFPGSAFQRKLKRNP